MSSPSEFSNNSEHQKVWDLLPWFINRSLDATEKTLVENHLKTCITCRIELNQQQQVYHTIQQADLLQQVSQVSFNQLKKRIAEKPAAPVLDKPGRSGKFWKLHFPFPLPFPGWAQYAAVAAAVLLLVFPLAFDTPSEQPHIIPEYRTLAQSPETGLAHHQLPVIRFIFADPVNDEQIETVLDSLSGHNIEGPFNNGMYELHFNSEQADSPTLDEFIARLRSDNRIFFAELAHEPFSSNPMQQQ